MQTNKLAMWQRMAVTALVLGVSFLSPAMLGAQTKGPDAANYTATGNVVYSFIDLVGGSGSASVLGGTDEGVALLTLPFTFQYYGTGYTLACVSANGLITFVTSSAACVQTVDFANTDLTATAPPIDGPTLAPYWTDLSFQVSGAGAVYYRTIGTTGSRRFVIEYSNAFPPQSQNPVTFEVVLQETSNTVLFQYQTVDLGSGNAASNGALATVGIRDTGGNTSNRQIAWSFDAAVLGNSSAILFARKVAIYTVGDVFPSAGTAIGYFGDASIDTLDLLVVLRQVTGAVPVDPCSDLFDAMDAYPADGTSRGGDGAVDTRDLLVVLRRVTGVDTSRPTRQVLVRCGVSAQLRRPRPNPAAAEGALQFGAAQASGAKWRTPVYLRAGTALNLGGIAFAAESQGNILLTFVPVGNLPPSVTDEGLPGKLSVAWLQGQQAAAGANILLGYIETASPAALHFIGIGAHEANSERPVHITEARTGARTR